MELALTLVTVLAIAVGVAALAGRWSMSAPLVLIVAGIVGSYLPFVPEVELTPDIVLLGLLPPLLYSAAIKTSLLDFNANIRPIGLLSVGLVLFTTAGIGYLTMNAREFLQTDVVLVGILLYALLGKLADVLAKGLERWWLRWHPGYQVQPAL